MSADYGAGGLVAILTPQANTTVEAELGVLLGPDVATIVSRLICYEPDSRTRLMGYFGSVAASLRAFDTAKPDFGLFACTGSTYLIGLEEEDRAFAGLALPLISAARAVVQALNELNAKRIALVSPYPAWLTDACIAFWHSHGKTVLDVRAPPGDRSDSRRIYDLGSAQALEQINGLSNAEVDCIIVTGTGMPSLAAIAKARTATPVLSSNLCLAWAAHRKLGREVPLERWLAADAPWRERLALRFPKALQ